MSKLLSAEALGLGLALGGLYFGVNVAVHFPHEQLFLMSSVLLRLNLFVYSYCVWTLGFLGVSLIVQVATMPLVAFGETRLLVFCRRAIIYSALLLAFFLGFAVWIAYGQLPTNLPDPIKLAVIRRAVVVTGLFAVVGSCALSALAAYIGKNRTKNHTRSLRVIILIAASCAAYVVAVNGWADGVTSGRGIGVSHHASQPQTIVMVVDAGSWNVLIPFLEQGVLPAMTELMESGTSGYLDTYGRQFTPPSWTSIATGKHEAKHGVHGFTSLSSDWLAAPLWSIMSSYGKTVGVVNWICTWPPFDVNGVFISEVISDRSGVSQLSKEFDELALLAKRSIGRWDVTDPDSESAIGRFAQEELDRILEIEHRVMPAISPDLVAYGYYSTDKVQHFNWRDMRQGEFTTGDWRNTVARTEYENAVKNVWVGVDRFLAILIERHGSGARYFILSDHGSRPIRARRVDLDVDELLAAMGLLRRTDGRVDRSKSTCFLSTSNTEPHVYNLEIGIHGVEPSVPSGLSEYRRMRSHVIERLRQLRIIGSDEPLFRLVEAEDEGMSSDGPGIRATASGVLTTMPGPEVKFAIDGRIVKLRDFMRFHPWSGRHRARGMFIASGPSIRHRYTGAWTIDEPYSAIIREGRGMAWSIDLVAGVFGLLHSIDELTTVDIAPTILYLTGIPVADDMDGRVARQIIDKEWLEQHPMDSVPTHGLGEVVDRDKDVEDGIRLRQRLKALGYL